MSECGREPPERERKRHMDKTRKSEGHMLLCERQSEKERQKERQSEQENYKERQRQRGEENLT